LNTQAQKLLQEAGYSKENPVKLKLLYNTSDMHQKLAIAAVSVWKKNLAGMAEVQLENQEWKTFLESRRLGKQQIARGGWCAGYDEPSAFLNVVMSNSSNNRFFYKNKTYDALMHKTLSVQTDQERAEIYHQAEALIDKESVMVPVYYYANTRFIKPWVGGYTGVNPINEVKSKDLYIIKR
ncbi:MAG: ABC transporter substrate-binding protein, partial [Enterobacteriaceae bacterium]